MIFFQVITLTVAPEKGYRGGQSAHLYPCRQRPEVPANSEMRV